MGQMLAIINSLFRDETNRRMLPRNMLPILSRKIVDSNLLNRMHELLQIKPIKPDQFDDCLFMGIVVMVYNISGETPNMIVKMVENNFINDILEIFQTRDLPTDYKNIQ